MLDSLPEDLEEPVFFQVSGHKDSREDIEENINSFGGKNILIVYKDALLSSGWSESTERYDSEVFAEDWGWCLFLRHEGALIMLGLHVYLGALAEDEPYRDYLKTDWVDCGLTLHHFHKRTLIEKLRGRNKANPAVLESAFRSNWQTLSGQDYIRNVSLTEPELLSRAG